MSGASNAGGVAVGLLDDGSGATGVAIGVAGVVDLPIAALLKEEMELLDATGMVEEVGLLSIVMTVDRCGTQVTHGGATTLW